MRKLLLVFAMACLALPTVAGELTPGTRIRLMLTRSAVSEENVWIVGRLVRADPRSLTVAPEGERGIVQVPREAERLGGRRDVVQVVRHASAVCRGRLGRADVHVLVQLAAVRVHDVAVEASGQLQRKPTFARGCRADDGDERRQRL